MDKFSKKLKVLTAITATGAISKVMAESGIPITTVPDKRGKTDLATFASNVLDLNRYRSAIPDIERGVIPPSYQSSNKKKKY